MGESRVKKQHRQRQHGAYRPDGQGYAQGCPLAHPRLQGIHDGHVSANKSNGDPSHQKLFFALRVRMSVRASAVLSSRS